nr:hypothetical protein [Tanacetum cinerariifolium]
IKPAPDPSTHNDPFVNSVHDSCRVSTTEASGGLSSGISARKSARISPFINVLDWGSSDKCCFSCLKACFAFDVQWKSLFLMHFFKVLNSRNDFSADLERNQFRLANFPLRLSTSLIVRGDESCSTTSVLLGYGFIPSGLIMYPKNIPLASLNTVLIAQWEADKYTIRISFGLGATSRGSSDKCCFSCLKACFASDVQWKSLFLMHFFKVLNSGKDFSADLERNLFILAASLNSSTYTFMFRPTWLSKALSTSRCLCKLSGNTKRGSRREIQPSSQFLEWGSNPADMLYLSP